MKPCLCFRLAVYDSTSYWHYNATPWTYQVCAVEGIQNAKLSLLLHLEAIFMLWTVAVSFWGCLFCRSLALGDS